MGSRQCEKMRLSFYCTSCLPGYHLPYIAAGTNGLFADLGLDVELLEPAAGPENVRRVSSGGADFCLTSVTHFLTARARYDDVAARFVAVVVQRSPMAALVPEGSPLRAPADLAGCRVGGPADSHLVADYQASLDHLGVGRSDLVPMGYFEAWDALADGQIDAVADYVDVLPSLERDTGVRMRAIPLGIEVYSSGLVAADRLSTDQVAEVREAVCAALERQRRHPDEGVEALQERHPEVDRDGAIAGWSLAVPNIFTGPLTGTMTPERWATTIDFVTAAHNLPSVAPEEVYRPAFAAAPAC